MKLSPGIRVEIAAGPGEGLAGVVVARRGPGGVSIYASAGRSAVWVMFDREPGVSYPAPVTGLRYESAPKKPRAPSVRRSTRTRRVS